MTLRSVFWILREICIFEKLGWRCILTQSLIALTADSSQLSSMTVLCALTLAPASGGGALAPAEPPSDHWCAAAREEKTSTE